MMRYLCLTHFNTDLGHESPMKFAAQLALLITLSKTFLCHGILPLHIVDDFMEGTFLTLALGVLAAIPAAIHLGLMPSGDGRGVTVALNAQRNQGHVWIHDLAIAAEVDTPQIRTQSVLRHRPYVASPKPPLPLGTLNFVETSQEGSLALSEKR